MKDIFTSVASRRRGLSLLEVLVAVFILASVIWSVQYLYASLLKGTSQSENKQAAVAAGETVFSLWQSRVSDTWTEDVPGLDGRFAVEGAFQELAYRVEVGPRLNNPNYRTGDPVSRAKIQIRPIVVRVRYEERGIQKEMRLSGAASK